ncbi:MAG: preprotein translocase subunit YajC [Lachnospiraceae bacterium]|jgi:preprotein translocase subunit YajC|nr:preprotein translocase subunit YajC [Lachnospiraceae bacterium]
MSILAANVQTISMVVWIVLLVGVMYFLMVRPQQKETKRKNAMMSTMEVGDTVLTTSGFYGTLIDIQEDTLIVEFGNNKNCRIPMQKAAVAAIEKAQ